MKFVSRVIEKYQTEKKYKEFIRFCIVGGLCTVIDGCIFYTVRLVAPYQVALVCGYCLSFIVNYFLTVHWTFQQKANAKNAVGVVFAHIFNLFVVRFGLMHLFVSVLGISDQIAFFPTFGISVITNFLIVRFLVTKI